MKSSLESRVAGGGRELSESAKLRLFEIRRDLVDAGLGADFVLVAARCTGHPDGADRVPVDDDRQRALRRDDVGEKERAGSRIALDVLGKLARRGAEGSG